MSRRSSSEQRRRTAVAELYEQHSRLIRGYARKAFRGDLHDADEVVQETFVVAYRQFDLDIKGKSTERQVGFLMAVAKNKIIDRFRVRKRMIPSGTVTDEDQADDSSVDPPTKVIDKETAEKLWEILSCYLSEAEHRVAFLSYEHQMPDLAIAEILDIAEVTVRTHRSRAKRKIKNVIGDRVKFPDSLYEFHNIENQEEATS